MNLVDTPGLTMNYPFNFTLPAELEASEPTEARGLARDEVRLMVSYRASNRVVHTQFRELDAYLDAGDLLVINTSGTMNAALQARRADGTACELHLSTRLPTYLESVVNESFASTLDALHLNKYQWVVEVRLPTASTTKPLYDAEAGEMLQLPGGATATLHLPYSRQYLGEGGRGWTGRGRAGRGQASPLHDTHKVPTLYDDNERTELKCCGGEACPGDNGKGKSCPGHTRLWIATLQLPMPVQDYLARYGFPIRYAYVKQEWAASYYQTVYATEVGSAEMPSAGRAFTPELITRLVAQGIQIAPLILHTGVASLEEHEPPYEEFYRVPLETARQVNLARTSGKRVIAVGTTVVRALESVTDIEGTTHVGEGWTGLVITPQRGIRAVNAMLTGLHEPYATHLAMLEALCGVEHLKITYQEALRHRYLWHEFGDLHLILP
jgi:S-adenosylmethionine:tRNA ribosyltransferase-isomerase